MGKIKFTQIPDKLNYPPMSRAQLSTYHSSIISYVSDHYQNRASFRRDVIDIMNTLTYIVISGDSIPISWKQSNPLYGLNYDVSPDELEYSLTRKGVFIDESNLIWDLKESDTPVPEVVAEATSLSKAAPVNSVQPIVDSTSLTPKEDLYIRPPLVPRFDTSRPWLYQKSGSDTLAIYTTLPEIPTKQNEISVTTDINLFNPAQLLSLYPNHFIRTRSPEMYQPVDGVDFDDQLGIILPIKGFTKRQIVDNIIKYPHLFQLTKLLEDGSIVSFYTTIEIDGTLYRTSEIWDTLPDAKKLPNTPEFIKEYVVRRYLLERDVKRIQHKFPLFGTLDPFLTLFTTPDEYAEMGYKDATDIARQCVSARVSYKQSRNPILRRLDNV